MFKVDNKDTKVDNKGVFLVNFEHFAPGSRVGINTKASEVANLQSFRV